MATLNKVLGGVDIGHLMTAPLKEALKAQAALSEATLAFLRGLCDPLEDEEAEDEDQDLLDFGDLEEEETTKVKAMGPLKTTTFAFGLSKVGTDGKSKVTKSITVPLLCLVHVPNLQIQSVNTEFSVEVKTSTACTSASKYTSTSSGSYRGYGGWWYGRSNSNWTGSYSAYGKSTRSTDSTSKYTIRMVAKNRGATEGMSRVLNLLNKMIPENALVDQLIEQQEAATETTTTDSS
eukprot:TRINITY_DN1643_c0_g1_i1.p1 TRINITY_DN1643_c0_g1~~TRINITY_DN1643_c0_g1_i1.p1  ORF type:complete len:235 (+),score=88.07 TRINITY_DN1643_c0_g1_i1:170-874(+)